jgi:hypothetical protein
MKNPILRHSFSFNFVQKDKNETAERILGISRGSLDVLFQLDEMVVDSFQKSLRCAESKIREN